MLLNLYIDPFSKPEETFQADIIEEIHQKTNFIAAYHKAEIERKHDT
jgi:hypothetical protein